MKNRRSIFRTLAAVMLLFPLIEAFVTAIIVTPVNASAPTGQIMTKYETESNNVYSGWATEYTFSLNGVVQKNSAPPTEADWVTPSNYYDTGWARNSWNKMYTYSNFGEINQTNDPMSIPPTATWATISSFQIEGTQTVPIRDTIYHYSINGTDVLTVESALLIPPNALWASLVSFNDGWIPSKNHTYVAYTLHRAEAPSVQSFTISSNSGHSIYAKSGDVVTIELRTYAPIAMPILKIAGVKVQASGGGAYWSASLELAGNIAEGTLPVYAATYSLDGAPGPVLSTTTDGSSVIYDNTGPVGTLSINGGAAATNSANVILNVTTDGTADQWRFSNDGTTWSGWETVLLSKPWTLAAGDGAKTVYLQLRDVAGNITVKSDNITLKTTAPNGTIEIDNGALYTKAENVLLSIGSDDTGSEMRFSNDGTVWSDWELYTATKTWALASGDGTKTVHLQLRNAAGIISDYSSSILLDTTRPVGSIVLNVGEAWTTDPVVEISLTADDGAMPASGVVEASISTDGGTTWSPWEHGTSQLSVTLTGFGSRTVFVKVRDAAGNESVPFWDDITLRSIPVVLNGTLNGVEDTPYTFTASDFGYTNDDGTALDRIEVKTLPAHGELRLNGVNAVAGVQFDAADAGKLVFKPDDNWNGVTSFEWAASAGGVASSGSTTVIIAIAAVNGKPTVSDLAFTTQSGQEIKGQLQGTDIDGDSLIFSIVDWPISGKLTLLDAATGEFSFIPSSDGKSTFTYRAYDGTVYSNIATVEVTNNRSPSIGGTVTGMVYGPGDTPIGGASVSVGSIRTVTDAQGQFTLSDVSAGSQTITVSSTGYNNGTATVTVTAGQSISAGIISLTEVTTTQPTGPSTPTTNPIGQTPPSTTEPPKPIDSTPAGANVFNSNIIDISKLLAFLKLKVDEANQSPAFLHFSDIKGHWAEQTILDFVKLGAIQGNGKGEFIPNGNITRAELASILVRLFNIQSGTVTHSSFTDITGHWGRDAILSLAQAGIIQGYPDSAFRPNQAISREEIVIIFTRILNLDALSKDSTKGEFTDLSNSFAVAEIEEAAQVGIINGKENGKFEPKSSTTRAEVVKIIMNVLNLDPRLKSILDSLK